MTFKNKGCGFFASKSQLVSGGPKWAPEWHHFDTFLPSRLNDFGTKECRSYRAKIFSKHPFLSNVLSNRYIQIAEEKSYQEANLFLGRVDKELHLHDLNLSSDIDTLKQFSEQKAQDCFKLTNEYGYNNIALKACLAYAAKYDISFTNTDNTELLNPTLNKLSCNKWWLKQINKKRIRLIEQVNRNLNQVNKHNGCYSSNFAEKARQSQIQNSMEYLASNEIVNQDGQTYSLLEIYRKSVSNPKIRKAELMTRIRGFEEVASEMGHAGEFYTITAPSRMHASKSNGKMNPKYDGSDPKQVNEYFNSNWQLIRSALQKKDIKPYGFRVVEPHHDGTPHWHLLLFIHPEDRETVRAVFRKYSLLDSPNEKGAAEHRFKAISIDPKKGSAAGYIAKYISKNIDGADIEQDNYGNQSISAAKRIDAWASTWGIRQFQQIGGPSVTVWRELRRLKDSIQPEMKNAHKAADSGNWAAFVLAMGGAMLPRRSRPIKPLYEIKTSEKVIHETGEIIKHDRTYYGELRKPSISGVSCKNILTRTRTMLWKRFMEPTIAGEPRDEVRAVELAALHPVPT